MSPGWDARPFIASRHRTVLPDRGPVGSATMTIRLYDTARSEVVELQPREDNKVSFYACGPTVYDLPHLGHGRMMLVYDIFRRYLEYRGFNVHHVSNITDIEDKIINRSKESGVPFEEITTKYEAEWWAAMDRLNIKRPHDTPHATAYVEQMVALIQDLIDAGSAYETDDSIYFSPESVSDYGLLAHQSIDSLRAGARVERDEQKRAPVDFALWKKTDAASGEPVWNSPWGTGRPGWHTECVVMSLDILGEGFDIHAGGLDLCFPHHENERAQAVAWGKTFAKHWMHNGFIEMGGEKMSKSLGNFTTLTDMLNECDPRAYRLLVLRSHYRAPLEVTRDTISDAETAMQRLDDFARRFKDVVPSTAVDDSGAIRLFETTMDDDLDTPGAVAQLFGLVRQANAAADVGDESAARTHANAALVIAGALGLELKRESDAIDDATRELMEQRDAARAAKNWADADALRDALQSLGWTVEDTPEGTRVHR
jgi:cysteinyl-tRNA synthetase